MIEVIVLKKGRITRSIFSIDRPVLYAGHIEILSSQCRWTWDMDQLLKIKVRWIMAGDGI
jgi:hypothetical protein